MQVDEYGYAAVKDVTVGTVIQKFDDSDVEVSAIEETADGNIKLYFKKDGQTGNVLISSVYLANGVVKIAEK